VALLLTIGLMQCSSETWSMSISVLRVRRRNETASQAVRTDHLRGP
jgi:hypothetical protein